MDKDALIKKIRQAQESGASEEVRAVLDYMAYFHFLDNCRDGAQPRRKARPCPDAGGKLLKYQLD